MGFNNPTVGEFKTYFYRDFPFGTDPATSVTDTDIVNAFAAVNAGGINTGLFVDQNAYTLGYELLAAHYLVLSLRSSSQGISGQYNWNETSKSVGSVSQGFSIPDYVQNNPFLSMLTKTTYGARYLEMVLPQLPGQMFNAYGTTLP